MDTKINNYSNVISTTYNNKTSKANEKNANTTKSTEDISATNTKDDTAVIYEMSSTTDKSDTFKTDSALITKLKADTEQRTNQLYSLVQKMFNKQGITFNNSQEMFSILRNGNFTADPDTIAQAKKDISEDGYWGVEQTSDRLVSFAQALSGNDPEQADKMIAAVKKGFEQATKTWGGKLPDICQNTLDTTIEKLEKWRDGINSNNENTITEE